MRDILGVVYRTSIRITIEEGGQVQVADSVFGGCGRPGGPDTLLQLGPFVCYWKLLTLWWISQHLSTLNKAISKQPIPKQTRQVTHTCATKGKSIVGKQLNLKIDGNITLHESLSSPQRLSSNPSTHPSICSISTYPLLKLHRQRHHHRPPPIPFT